MKQPLQALRHLCKILLKTCFSFEINGTENLLRHSGPVILAGNHTGLLDGPAILASYHPAFSFLISTEVLDWGLIGKIMPLLNTINIDKQNPRSGLHKAIQILKQGQSLCIFPEGQLTETGEAGHFHAGIALLQEKAQVPIIPFAISGGFEAWPVGKRFPRFVPVQICFGTPILPNSFKTRSALLLHLEQTIQELPIKTTPHQVLV